MKLNLAIFLCVIMFSCTNGQTGKVTSNEKNQSVPDFSIEFPKTEYNVEKTEQYDKSQGVLITNWILQGKTDNGPFMFFVAHNIVPEKLQSNMENPTLREIALKAMLTGSAIKLGGTDFSFTKIKYENYDGMESICKVFDGDGFIKSKVFVIENNIFCVSAGGRKISVAEVDNFLNSFSIKK